jgi:uncharacterized protein (DUF1800 family)
MSLDPSTFSPTQAWAPLKPTEWNEDNARHLLHRIGFSATPDRVALALKQGMSATLIDAFGTVRPMPLTQSIADYSAKRADLQGQIRAANQAAAAAAAVKPAASAVPGNPSTAPSEAAKARTQLQTEANQLERQAFVDYVQEWLTFARQPENSAQENLVMFLSNVLVVAQSKVKDPERLFMHGHLLRSFWQKPMLDLMKSLTFSPAMIQYLDLDSSVKGVPNENYAREVMELFTLGEGHYTENDIKEAARALTGIVIRPNDNQGIFVRTRWDEGVKTIYGKSGTFGALDVIDLIYQQPAARTHLPKRFLTYYLSDQPLPAPYMEELGNQWAATWRMDDLARIVFSSKLFYQPEFRRALIKSPIQYYLGLCQDLNLDVSPFDNQAYNLLKSMGQEPFNPPNVRGWLGDKNWINSSTFAARRQLVQSMFNPPNENNLTADMKLKLADARKAGHGAIAMTNDRLDNLAGKTDAQLADLLLNYFLAGETNDAYRRDILDYMQNDLGQRVELVRDVATALFQSPEYHLC